MSQGSVAAYLTVMTVGLLPSCIYLVRYYAEPGFPWHEYITLTLGYYAGFAILLIVPIDIAFSIIDRRSTDSNLDGDSTRYVYDLHVLSKCYNVFFTMVLILSNVVLVYQEYYVTDGYFTEKGKHISSFKRMSFDMLPPAVVGCIILGVIIGQGVVPADGEALKLAAVIVTNTVYEFMLMFLLAYALVEFPRSIWNQSNLEKYLGQMQSKAAGQFADISDANLSVSLVVSDVLKTKNSLKAYADQELNDAMEICISECPPEFRSDRMGTVACDKKGKVTVYTLATLRTRLNVLKDRYKMSQEKVEVTKMLCYKLEDIIEAKEKGNATTIHWTLSDTESTPFMYNWEIKYRPVLLKIAAVLFLSLSLFSFLGVINSMKGVSQNTSVYFLAVHGGETVGGITLFILVTLGYVTYLTTWALFQMRLAGLMELVPHRTTPESLSFNVRRITGFAAPLAFFYLGWLNENGIKTGPYLYNDAAEDPIFMPSAFSHFYQIQSVYIIKQTFGTIFPVLLVVLMFLFTTNIFNRALVLFKMDKYQFGARIVTEEQLREGKRQLQRHRKHTERGVKRVMRGEKINSIMNNTTSAPVSITSKLWFGRSSSVDKQKLINSEADGASSLKEAPRVKEPDLVWGSVEKKSSSTSVMGGTSWKAVHATVVAPGYLHFYKDEQRAIGALGPKHEGVRYAPVDTSSRADGSESMDSSAQVVDLRLIIDFSKKHVKANSAELHLERATTTVKLRFTDIPEMEKWRSLLMDWKDYSVDFGKLYRHNDTAPKQPSSRPAPESLNPGMGNADEEDIDLDDLQMDMEEGEAGSGHDSPVVSESSNSGNNRNHGSNSYLIPATKSSFVKELPPKYVKDDDLNLGTKPAPLEGWLEKKNPGKIHLGADYQKRFLRVDVPSNTLKYYKTSKVSETAAGAIDLKLIRDITPYFRDGKEDHTKFNIDTGDKVYKFKAPNAQEGTKWIDGLNDWHDYFLMQM
jgi:hypothetical protein